MHAYTATRTVYRYPSDLSGDVEITDLQGNTLAKVPSADLVSFLAYWLRLQKIVELEQASDAQILGISEEAFKAIADPTRAL